jgi:D-serine deaminase-like pyridoxal phosphate-dependent protein
MPNPQRAARLEARGPELYQHYERLFRDVPAPFAFVDLDALWANALDMLEWGGDKTLRVASKSIRCRELLHRIIRAHPRFKGALTFTLPETIWLAEHGFRDMVLAYPSVSREALRGLIVLNASEPRRAPTIMIDSVRHVEILDRVRGGAGPPVRVCIDVDAGYWTLGGRVKVGPKRSPVHTPEQAVELARAISTRRGVKLVGLMLYEGQIAGVPDSAPGHRLRNIAIRRMKRASAQELAKRRAAVVDAVSEVADLEFVNGGGTGSLTTTSDEPAVTEVTVGSGFYAPALFDHYERFRLRPAAMFAVPVVRRPSPKIATALGGGYLASGAGAPDRMPQPYLPHGLELDSQEGAGEVQTPLLGDSAAELRVGDRVYFRHAKAGEICERFNSLYLVENDQVTDEVPTYRGEGQAFL